MQTRSGAASVLKDSAASRTGPENFEHRRARIWRANRALIVGSVAAIALALLVAQVLNVPAQLFWLAAGAAGALAAFTVARLVRALDALYRCPNCGLLPYRTLNEYKCGGLGPTRSNFMSPRACPYCGTRIR